MGGSCSCCLGDDSLLFWKILWTFPKKMKNFESFISSMITLVDFKNIIQSKLKDFLKCLICESVLVQIKLVLLVFNKGLVLTDFYFKIKPVNSVI